MEMHKCGGELEWKEWLDCRYWKCKKCGWDSYEDGRLRWGGEIDRWIELGEIIEKKNGS